MKKITLSTVRSFIKKNRSDLFVNIESSFDGMIDGLSYYHGGFTKAENDKTQSLSEDYNKRTLGILGLWFVGSSRDYFSAYEDNFYIGICVSNSCGSFILAIKK